MGKKGILVVVSGFSGSGKGSLMRELLTRYPKEYSLSISATTRRPRLGEKDGRDYFFLTTEAFEKLIEEDGFIEYARYVDNYYGTPKPFVLDTLAAGRDVILEIEIQGALKVKERFPDALLLFVAPPSAAELESRLKGRGTETDEAVKKRLQRAAQEAGFMQAYDYILINRDLEACRDEMHALIQTQHSTLAQNAEFVASLTQELQRFL